VKKKTALSLVFPAACPPDSKFLLALSGGVDSMVLAHRLVELGVDFAVAHCNFQLRDTASHQDEDFVKQWADNQGVRCFRVRLATNTYADHHHLSIQMAARTLRYQWFDHLSILYGFDYVLTAHHLDDQLETFLINSFRGTGLKGLLGIPAQHKNYIRPMLHLTKAEVVNYASQKQLLWREDASNQSNHYLRNHLRNRAIPPLFEAVAPHGREDFSTTLSHLESTQEFVDLFFEGWKKDHFIQHTEGQSISLSALSVLEPLDFCLHQLFAAYGFEAKEVAKLLKAESGKSMTSATHQLMRERDHLLLKYLTKNVADVSYTIPKEVSELTEPFHLRLEAVQDKNSLSLKNNQILLDGDTLRFPLVLRKWQKGDFFYPTGMQGKKRISKYFKDQKYTTLAKANQWLLTSNGQVVWVVGQRCDRRFTANEKTTQKLLISVLE
jgi:tRNA(Ile)-lysidine synthase